MGLYTVQTLYFSPKELKIYFFFQIQWCIICLLIHFSYRCQSIWKEWKIFKFIYNVINCKGAIEKSLIMLSQYKKIQIILHFWGINVIFDNYIKDLLECLGELSGECRIRSNIRLILTIAKYHNFLNIIFLN